MAFSHNCSMVGGVEGAAVGLGESEGDRAKVGGVRGAIVGINGEIEAEEEAAELGVESSRLRGDLCA